LCGYRQIEVQLTGSERIDLPEFTHTFTHFKLHITPVLLQLMHKQQRLQQSGSMWLDVEEALLAAISTPVRKLLNDLTRRG